MTLPWQAVVAGVAVFAVGRGSRRTHLLSIRATSVGVPTITSASLVKGFTKIAWDSDRPTALEERKGPLMSTSQPHIVIAGGGYVGMYTALRLQKKLRRGEARVTVIDPRSTMTYQPFLPEAAAGSLEPRHVVVSLRRTLKKTEVLTARVESVDAAARTVRVVPPESEPYDLAYDELVVAMGSISRTLPIPGLAEHGMGFKQIEEAIALRNHVLDRLDLADVGARSPGARRPR